MTLLAYDPERIVTLRGLVAAALAELDAIRHPDAIAAAAVRNARRALRDSCLPAIADVAQCSALAESGWWWSAGPSLVVAGTGPSPDLATWATARADRWTAAALEQALGAPGAAIAMQAIAAELRAMGRLLAHDVSLEEVDRLLDALPPLAAAHVLGALGLGDRELADRGYALLRREYTAIDDGSSTFLLPGLANTADIVAALVMHRPASARRWTELVTADPYVLFRAADRRLEQRALLVGTRPGVASAEAALGTVSALADHLHHGAFIDRPLLGDRVAPAWHDFLGELSAPWLPQLSGAQDVATWADAERRALTLRDICRSAAAAALLERALHQQLDDAARNGVVSPDGVVDQPTVQRLATQTIALHTAIADVRVDRAAQQRTFADAATAGTVAAVTGPLSAAATTMVAAGASRAVDWLTDRGWYPRAADQANDDERELLATTIADHELITVVTVASGLVDAGELPASFLDELHVTPRDACRSQDVDQQLRELALSVHTTHPRATDALLSTIGAFSNTASVSELCD